MADGRTWSRKAPRNSLDLCDELALEDGADPRTFFRRGGQPPNHKAKRLCGAAHRALALCLPSLLGGEAPRLGVEAVEPTAAPGWLLVILRVDQRLEAADRGRLLGILESARGALRAEIGSAISRR